MTSTRKRREQRKRSAAFRARQEATRAAQRQAEEEAVWEDDPSYGTTQPQPETVNENGVQSLPSLSSDPFAHRCCAVAYPGYIGMIGRS